MDFDTPIQTNLTLENLLITLIVSNNIYDSHIT